MAAVTVGADRRDQRDVRGTVTKGLGTGMGRKRPSSLQSRKMLVWRKTVEWFKVMGPSTGCCLLSDPGRGLDQMVQKGLAKVFFPVPFVT